MTFPEKQLNDGETVVIDRHPHWWFLVPRAAVLLLTIAFGVWMLVIDEKDHKGLFTGLRWLAVALVVLALLWFLARLLEWTTTMFVVTSHRCIYRSGILTKHGIEIPLNHINTVIFSQTFFERLVRAGDLSIESAGRDSRQNFSDIWDPVEVQNTIYRQMEVNENRKYDRIGSEAREARESDTGASPSVAEQIERLADLRDRGALSDEEFEAQKAALLNG